jgi:hypothetical protein
MKHRRPPSLTHDCCPNALRHIISHRTDAGYRWKMREGDETRHVVALIIYCPWCGVCLEEWRKLREQPRTPILSLVGAPE